MIVFKDKEQTTNNNSKYLIQPIATKTNEYMLVDLTHPTIDNTKFTSPF